VLKLGCPEESLLEQHGTVLTDHSINSREVDRSSRAVHERYRGLRIRTLALITRHTATSPQESQACIVPRMTCLELLGDQETVLIRCTANFY
jgi:hypothetical protein